MLLENQILFKKKSFLQPNSFEFSCPRILCSPGWPWTHYVLWDALDLLIPDSPASTSARILNLENVFFFTFVETNQKLRSQTFGHNMAGYAPAPCAPCAPSVPVPLSVCSTTEANAGCWPISTHNWPFGHTQKVKIEVLGWRSASCSHNFLNSFIREEGWISTQLEKVEQATGSLGGVSNLELRLDTLDFWIPEPGLLQRCHASRT